MVFEAGAGDDADGFVGGARDGGAERVRDRDGWRRSGVAVEEGEEDGFLHEFVDEFDGVVEGCWRWRGREGGHAEESVSDVAGEVDFAGRTGGNVRGQETLPEHLQMAGFGAAGGDGVLVQTGSKGVV